MNFKTANDISELPSNKTLIVFLAEKYTSSRPDVIYYQEIPCDYSDFVEEPNK